VAQRIARSAAFENVTFLVIIFNALWISVDADHNKADVLIDAHVVFQIAENTFCAFFSWELIVRFLAFKRKLNCFKDGWFVFDLTLVLLMVLETWVMSLFFVLMGKGADIVDASMLRLVRIVKILRLSRLARLVRAVPEIIILIKGIGAASRSVASLFALWLIIIYVFAVFFVQTASGDVKSVQFENVPTGMNTLLLEGILPDNSELVDVMSRANPVFWPIIVGFVLLASITLSYMLIGVLVQIVAVIADAEKEKAMVENVAQHLRVEWQEKGYEMDTILKRDQFQNLLVDPEVAAFLTQLGVDMVALVEMSGMMYEDLSKEDGGVSFEKLVNCALNVRGSNPANVQECKNLVRFLKKVVKDTVSQLEGNMNKQFVKSAKQMNGIRKAVVGEPESSSDSGEPDSPAPYMPPSMDPSFAPDSVASSFVLRHSQSCASVYTDAGYLQ